MIEGNALAQGLVGGLLLARGERAPKAGMRAGLLMAATGGFTPVGAVLAQSQIRAQLRADRESDAGAASVKPTPSPTPAPAVVSQPTGATAQEVKDAVDSAVKKIEDDLLPQIKRLEEMVGKLLNQQGASSSSKRG